MFEIEDDEYVRTDNGIDKFLYKDKYESGVDKYVFAKESMSNPEYYVLKHSKNIIDLIEVGDYINGEKVYKITGTLIYLRGKAPCYKSLSYIESIVTKEQFKQVQYKVGD